MENVLEVCLSPDLGGLELYVKQLVGFTGTNLVVNKKSRLKETFKSENLPFYEMGRYNFIKLAKLIDKNNVDIVHLHWTKDIPVVVLAKLLAKQKPKIVQTRHMHMTRFKGDFYHKFLYKNINLIIAVTNLVNQQLNKFIPQEIRPRIVTSYIGAKTQPALTYEYKKKLKKSLNLHDEFIVCITGRVEEEKGQHIVLEAVENLRQNGINAKTIVVGHYMDKSYYEKLKSAYPDDLFTGFTNKPADFMQIADCVVLATKKETFGLVLIEAMKCGTCVVASNSGGPLEIIDDEKTGLLFKSMDVNDLSAKLLLLTKDSSLKEMLALNGKLKAEQFFDSNKQFEELKNIFIELSSFSSGVSG